MTRRQKNPDAGGVLASTGVLIAFLAIWEGIVALHLVSEFALVAPSQVVVRGYELFQTGEIYRDLVVSGREFVIGLSVALLVGIPIGVLMGATKIGAASEHLMTGLYNVPMIAFLPVLIIWFGIGLTSKVALVALGAVFPVIINTMLGVRDTPRPLLEMSRAVCASRLRTLAFVRLPNALPMLLAGIRIALGRATIFVVVAEFYAANEGIGYRIARAGGTYDTSTVFLGALLLAIFGITCASILRIFERSVAGRRGLGEYA
jgi:NitT/TauT family transport system permease protein